MQRHHYRVEVPVPAASVRSLLEVQPATWLRRFLRLASVGGSDRPGAEDAPGWYRVGGATVAHGGASYAVEWWPHAGERLFRSFQGDFVVSGTSVTGCLELVGTADGGEEDTNATALRTLVELLGAALHAAG
jgi:hypothetical protein